MATEYIWRVETRKRNEDTHVGDGPWRNTVFDVSDILGYGHAGQHHAPSSDYVMRLKWREVYDKGKSHKYYFGAPSFYSLTKWFDFSFKDAREEDIEFTKEHFVLRVYKSGRTIMGTRQIAFIPTKTSLVAEFEIGEDEQTMYDKLRAMGIDVISGGAILTTQKTKKAA